MPPRRSLCSERSSKDSGRSAGRVNCDRLLLGLIYGGPHPAQWRAARRCPSRARCGVARRPGNRSAGRCRGSKSHQSCRRQQHDATLVADGAEVEIVAFVGGGSAGHWLSWMAMPDSSSLPAARSRPGSWSAPASTRRMKSCRPRMWRPAPRWLPSPCGASICRRKARRRSSRGSIATKIFLLPNTAACYTADDAVRTARLAQEAGLSNWIKLEVIGDEQHALSRQRSVARRHAATGARRICRAALHERRSDRVPQAARTPAPRP